MGRRSRGTNVRSAFTVFFLNLCLVSDVTTLEAASSFATRKRSTFSHAHHEGKKKKLSTHLNGKAFPVRQLYTRYRMF